MKSLAEIISSRNIFFGLDPSNLPILAAAWDIEYGGFSKYFSLEGVEKNAVVIRVSGSCAANDVKLREKEIIRTLNKYFRNKWIKSLKVVCKS